MILLDTHVLVWLSTEELRIGRRTRGAIDRGWARGNAAVSSITFWEAAMQQQKSRLTVLGDIAAWRDELLRDGLVEIPVDGAIAARAGLLPNLHGDPADRLILATALGGHQLITADARLLEWPGAVARLDARE